MAIKKNKDGIMAAISAAAEVSTQRNDTRERAQRALPRGTIGSVRAGLGGIQEIETDLILPWGPPDRLDPELTAVNSEEMPASIEELAESISTSGQQIPVLLRPSKEHDGKFEVVYGRRRIMACKQLGIAVKALIRTLDDTEALMAKGLENASRTDLSFYERARFATAIIAQGYDRATACQALSVSKNTLSQLERITRVVPNTVGDAIGSAPESGRPKWMKLADAIEQGTLDEPKSLKLLAQSADLNSDERLVMLIASANKSATPAKSFVETSTPVEGVQIKKGAGNISMSIKRKGKNKQFASWLDSNLDQLMQDAFEKFRSENETQ